MKTERVSLQKKHAVIQPFMAANKTKTKLKTKTTNAPRITYSL
jgi:hypothetical protein